MSFSCYSHNENMPRCKNQCDYCLAKLSTITNIKDRYAIKIDPKDDVYSISVALPSDLFYRLQEMKHQNPKELRLALTELIISKL